MDKVKKKIKDLSIDFIRKGKHFSYTLAVYNLIYNVNGSLFNIKFIQRFTLKKKAKYIFRYLKNLCDKSLDNVLGSSTLYREESIHSEFPIWTFWYQDIDCAPELVQACITNMERKHKDSQYKVHILTMNNLNNYVQFPDYIYEKVEKGSINLALFSDLIRISLLEKYGGIWIDPTCFCATSIPEEVFQYSFFSCKTENFKSTLISYEQWANYCLGTNKKNYILYRFLKEALLRYWKEEESDIDYLLTDYLIRFAYNNIPIVKEDIDTLNLNNPKRGYLMKLLNKEYKDDIYMDLIKDTWIFKLTYKHKLTDSFKNTFYHHLLDINKD